MPDTDYGYALKMGRKRYQDALARGEYPYLPVLDNILANTDIVATVNLGVMDIPLAKMVGTKTAERSSSFASNLCHFCRNDPNLGLNGHPFTSIR